MKTIHWGILSTGHIANEFIEGLANLAATEVIAVGSRNQATADAFADKWNIKNRHSSYEALANDPKVDVIYIATPHPFHKENSLLCLNAGKAVLCEKPFTLNAKDTRVLIEAAQANKVFLMDAIWVLFLPHMVKLRNLVAQGLIGDVRIVQADFGFRAEFDAKNRLFDKSMAGGSLLDVGLYPVMLAQSLLGKPSAIKSFASLGSTGVDEEVTLLLQYPQGETALLTSSIRLDTPNEAVIIGTKGRIHIREPWWRPNSLTLITAKQKEVIDIEAPLLGHNYEAQEVNNCLRAGKLESDILPLQETLSLMETLDTLRSQWGLKYPMED